jgi:hypothetical protein
VITIVIGGPQGSRLAKLIYKLLSANGFISVVIYTTSEVIYIPTTATREDRTW